MNEQFKNQEFIHDYWFTNGLTKELMLLINQKTEIWVLNTFKPHKQKWAATLLSQENTQNIDQKLHKLKGKHKQVPR